jgi:DNA polymerase elongation subunit (family B)
MYKKCYSKQLNENLHQIYLWDDKDGYSTFKWEDKMGFDGMYPYQKYLIEKYGYDNQPSENHQIIFFDLECEMLSQFNEEGFKESKLESIVYYHQNTDEWVCLIIGDKNKIQSEIDGKKIIVFEDEFSLLKHFLIKLIEIEVDILVGWNSDSFDIPYLYVRSKLLFGSEFVKLLSPIGIVKESFDFNPQNPIQIYGVESIDFMRIHKSVIIKEETSYKLDYIGEKYCDLKKIEYDGNLNQLYEKDITKFIEYNFRDVEILVELNKTLDYIPLILNVSHRGKVNYSDYLLSSRINDGCITSKMIQTYGLKSIPNLNNQLEKESVIGGFLFHPKNYVGISHYLFDLDIVSMYPSIIMSLNIGIDTYVFRIKTVSFKWYDKKDDNVNMFLGLDNLQKMNPNDKITIEFKSEEIIKKTDDGRYIKTHKPPQLVDLTVGELIKYIEKNKLSISSNGVCFKTDKQSSQSMVITDWFNERKKYKKKMLDSYKKGDDEMGRFYHIKQYSFKILMNSIYGCNNVGSFRWGNSIIANSITMSGRRIITESAKFINREINKVLKGETKMEF